MVVLDFGCYSYKEESKENAKKSKMSEKEQGKTFRDTYLRDMYMFQYNIVLMRMIGKFDIKWKVCCCKRWAVWAIFEQFVCGFFPRPLFEQINS